MASVSLKQKKNETFYENWKGHVILEFF